MTPVTEHRKRFAIEPPEALLAREPAAAPNAKRPISLALGAAFVFGRALASAFWFAAFALIWPEFATELELDSYESAVVFWTLAIFNILAVLVLLLFAWLIWRGSNTARVITMSVLTVSILTAAVGYFAAGERIAVDTTLLTVALDILVLLALSSRDARAWARRPRSRR